LIIVDAPLFAAWLLDERDYGPAHAVWDVVSGNNMMFLPVHLPNEIANALRRAVRTNRLRAEEIRPIAERLGAFKIRFAEPTPLDQIGPLAAEALEHGLSTYDMIYVRIARDHQYRLATIDKAMRAAARRMDVELLPG
jgi:predicted nucleic acid-binding protein